MVARSRAAKDDVGFDRGLCSVIHIRRTCFTSFITKSDGQYDGTLLASLIILPQWRAYFNNPSGNLMGLIAASFYFRKYTHVISRSVELTL